MDANGCEWSQLLGLVGKQLIDQQRIGDEEALKRHVGLEFTVLLALTDGNSRDCRPIRASHWVANKMLRANANNWTVEDAISGEFEVDGLWQAFICLMTEFGKNWHFQFIWLSLGPEIAN